MANPLRVPYATVDPNAGDVGIAPYLPRTLDYQGTRLATSALVDSGASLHVIPYSLGLSLGLSLGAVWREQAAVLRLGGSLGTVGTFTPVRLAFAWAQAEDVPLLLGQVNFFMELNVCFFRSQKTFEVQPKQ